VTRASLAVILLASSVVPCAVASASDIPPAYRQVALINGIPADIFYAVALTESGRILGVNQPRRPWPWTLNIHGQGLYFSDRHSAWRAVVTALVKQQPSVDIGLMQVNWYWHHHRLIDPWRALDPHRNLRVAAEILQRCYERSSDWWQAVGCYHSPSNPEHAERYRERVRAHWQSVVSS
jgi:hypothetical protein